MYLYSIELEIYIGIKGMDTKLMQNFVQVVFWSTIEILSV